MTARNRILEEAAEIADLFADENFRIATDTILLDPVIGNKGERALNLEDFKKAEQLQIEGCIHSSMAHAAQNIAEQIRAMKSPQQPIHREV